MSEFIDALQYGFIQRALIAGVFVGASSAFLGIFLVLKRFSMIGDGLAHFAFAAIGFAFLLGVYPFYVAAPLCVAASFGILYITEKSKVYGDAAIAILSAVGIASGVMLASVGGGFNVDLFSYLFGDILTVGKAETAAAAILSMAVIATALFFYHELFTVSFDEEYARVLGFSPKFYNRLLIMLTSLTVVLGIKVVGTMLVSSLVVLPAVTALQIAGSFKRAIAIAVVVAIVSVVFGIFFAFIFNLPAGSSIVLLNFMFFMVSFIISSFNGKI